MDILLFLVLAAAGVSGETTSVGPLFGDCLESSALDAYTNPARKKGRAAPSEDVHAAYASITKGQLGPCGLTCKIPGVYGGGGHLVWCDLPHWCSTQAGGLQCTAANQRPDDCRTGHYGLTDDEDFPQRCCDDLAALLIRQGDATHAT